MLKRIFIFIFFICWYWTLLQAQKPSQRIPETKDVNLLFEYRNYKEALKGYLQLLSEDPKNEEYNFNAAYCYLYTNINKAKAVPHLEIVTRLDKHDPDAWFLLGRAYHYAYRFDDAISAFEKFRETDKGSTAYKKETDRYIQYCQTAKEMVKYPVNVQFENLGKNINSPNDDYFPFVPTDESFLVFTTRRPQGAMKDIDGMYTSSVFISRTLNGQFSKAKSIGSPINTSDGDEEVVGLSNSGAIMLLLYNNYVGFADLYLATMEKNKSFRKAEVLSKNVNSDEQEISAAINDEGDLLIFTSTRKGGKGGSDLYMSRKLPDGSWGLVVNIEELNTPYDEDFPNFSDDGKTLYFSSSGHTSMGGYDIFKCEWNEENKKWENIKNIGYPVNTPDDDMNYRVTGSGRHAYIASQREGGFGDLDIYRVTYKNVEPRNSLISGFVTSASSDSGKNLSFSKVFITVTDNSSNEIVGNYIPHSKSGKFVIILPPGEYTLKAEAPGHKLHTEKIIIEEMVALQTDIEKNLILFPEGYNTTDPANADKSVSGQE